MPLDLDALREGQDFEAAVHQALREALVNALVHADYRRPGGVRVLRHRLWFEFSNPGRPLLPLAQMRQGGRTETRNPALHHMFSLAGLGERAGSGVPSILKAWREQHWQLPELIDEVANGETRLVLKMSSLFPAEEVDRLRAAFGGRFDRLPEHGRLAVATAALEGSVTNRRLQSLTEAHGRDLTFLLKSLVEEGIFVPHGERQGRSYSVNWPAPANEQQLGTPRGGNANSPQSYPQSSQQSSPRSAPDPVANGGPTAPQTSLVLRVAEARWSPREDVEGAILELCARQYRTASDIAKHLNRNEATIKNHYLSRLLRDGRLELRFSETPNHPLQAYRRVPNAR